MNTPTIFWSSGKAGLLALRRLEITPVKLLYLEGVVAIFIAVGSLTWPLGGDHSFFYFAGDTIVRGGVLYRDAWELKGPLTYYISAFFLVVFGHHEISIRIFDLIVIGLFCLWLQSAAIVVRGNGKLGTTFTIVYFLLQYYLCFGTWETAQPDEWGGLLIAVAVMLSFRSSWSPNRIMAIAGSLIALAALIKPTFLVFLPLPILYAAPTGRGWSAGLASRGICVMACVATITICFAAFFHRGGLAEYWDVLHFLSTSYYPFSQRHLLNEAHTLPGYLWNLGVAIPYLLTLPAIGLIWHKGYRRLAQILATWFALALILVLAQGTYWPYTFTPANITVAAILGNSLSLLDSPPLASHFRQLMIGFYVLVIGLSVLTSNISDFLFGSLKWPGYVLGVVNKTDYISEVMSGYTLDEDQVAAYIDSHSNEDDTIVIWSSDIRVLAIGKRQSASRFGQNEALVSAGPLQAKYRDIFLGDVSRQPPRFVVVDSGGSWYSTESNLWLLKQFAEFDRFLRDHYKLRTHFGRYQLWEKAQGLGENLKH